MPEAPQIPAANFQITPDLRLGEGGEAEKFRDNIAAIKALKAIEAGNRRATAEEQRILARYVGWGGIPNAFPSPGTKEFKSEWRARGEELLGLLTPQEHRKASGSTTDAHYTSETVTTAIWDGVKRLGYRGGLALEMSLGSGNFIGLMPQDVAGRTRFIGVELDSITARIARALYPQATVLESGMQYVPLADNGFDLDIGNPPFGDTSLTWQHKPGLRGMSIHNQFFVAGLEALKPGGIQAKVVSRYLLDAMDPAARIALAKKGKLLAAIRLPETAFKTNARTSVVTDIVFIQRLTKDEEFRMGQVFAAANGKPEKKPEDERARQALAQEVPAWVKTVEVRDPLGGEPMKVNHYFRANPDMIVGAMDRSGSMAHGNDITVKLDKTADFGAELAKRIARLPEGIALREDAAIDASIERYKSMADALEIYVSGQEPGQLVVGPDNKLLQVFERETPEGDYELAKREITPTSPWSPQLLMDGKGQWYREVVKLGADGKPEKQAKKDGTPSNLNVVTREVFGGDDKVPESLRLGQARFEQLRDIAALRDLLKKQLVLEAQDDTAGKMEANRKDLAAAYDAYVAKHGFVSNGTTSRLVNDMPDGALIQALELSYKAPITAKQAAKTGDKAREASVKRAPILSRRVVVPYAPPGRAETPADAMQISLSERGMIDVDRIAALRGLSVEEVEAELTDGETPLAFHDPELKRLETRNAYLTGEVARKLRAAKDAGLARNVEALQKVQPEPITSDNVTVIIGNTWVPSEVYAQFVQHITGEPAQVSYEPLTNTRTVRGTNSTKSKEWAARNESGNVTVEAVTLLQDAMNSETTKVYYRDIDGNQHLHKEDTELAAVKRGEIEREFTEWAFADATRRRLLVDKFNEKFNTRVTRQHDGSHLTLPGKVPDQVISMRRHQKNAIWRGIAERFMLLDHVVGAGKTYTAIARVMERRRMGLSAKPMIVVPNHMVEQFAADVYRLYPGAKVLAAGKSDFEKRARRRLFAKIATGDWDVVVVPHSSFGFIGLSPETEDAFLQDELRQALKALKDAEAEAPAGRFKPLGVKKAEQLVKKIEARIDAIRGDKKDRLLSFEQMGVDDLTVDEAHEFKNLFYSTRMSDVRGMGNASGSQKAFDLYTKVRYLRTTPTGSVVFMTGTPISNSAVEMYTMMRYLAADELRDLGLEHFDAWRTQFVDASTGYEQQLTGGVKEVGRLGRTWGNARSLMDLYYSFTDAVTIEDIKTAFAEDNPGKVFPVPKVKGGERQQIVVQPSPALLETLKQIFDDYDNLPNIQDPKVRNADRLRLMDRARKASLDLRAVDPTTTSKEEGGKLDRVADEVARIHKKWTPDRGAQMIFLDRSVPKSKNDLVLLKAYDKAAAARDKALADNNEEAYREAIEDLDKFDANEVTELRAAQAGGWNAYQQIKDNLIARGVPANEIRFIQEANNDEQKQAMFDAVNAGDIRVLIGSTPRMGAGTNAQERMVALHHVDVGWKPSDIEQREGRIVRQGNGFMDPERGMYRADFEVEILAYATERTADAAMWALNGMKLKTINGIRKYDGSFTMEFEDDDSLSMAHMAALASGDPLLLERIKLVGEVDKLERQETAHRRKIIGLQDNIEEAERSIGDLPAKITANEQRAAAVSGWESGMAEAAAKRTVEVEGKTYTSRFQAASAAMSAAKEQQGEDDAAKFAVTIAGKRITSKTGIENTLDEAFGDVEPIEATIAGKKVVSRAGVVRAIIDRARELAINLDKGASEGFDIGTTMGMKLVGDVERSSWGTGAYEVSFSVLDESGKMLATGKAYGQAATHDFSHQFVRASVDRLFTGKQANDYQQTVDAYRFALDRKRRELPELKRQLAASGPFKHTIDLEQKRMRLAEVTRLLTVGGKDLKHIDDFGSLFIASPQTLGQDDFGQQIDLSEGATVYSRNGGPAGVHMADAKAIVEAIRAANPAAPTIHVHETLGQAPKALRDAINKAGAQGDVEAAFHEGEIHVFPRHMASVERMAFVVGHHEIRHYGLRSILGPRLGPVALSLWTTNPALRAAAQKVIDDGHATSRVLAIEEALADMPVADLEKLTGWNKVVAAIRNWLRGVAQRLREARFPALADAFEPDRWTDNDVAALVGRAEGVSKGGSSAYRAGGTVFGRESAKDGDYGNEYGSEFWRRLGRLRERLANARLPEAIFGRSRRRTGAFSGNQPGRITTGLEPVTFGDRIGGWTEFVSFAKVGPTQGGNGFSMHVVPLDLLQSATAQERRNPQWDARNAVLTISLYGEKDFGFNLSIQTPEPGEPAFDKAAPGTYKATGQMDAGGVVEYQRLNIGNAAIKDYITEAVRRFGLNKGFAPDIIFNRDTGANPSETPRTYSADTVEARFSRVPSATTTAPSQLAEALTERERIARSLRSVAQSPKTAQDFVKTRGGVFDFNRMGETGQDRVRSVVDKSRPFWLGALTRDQIADVYGKEIPQIKDYDTLTRAMENQRSSMAQKADDLYQEWSQLPTEVNDRLARIMLDATVNQVHPDREGPPAKATADQKQAHARVRESYLAMPTAGQAMYAKVRDAHAATLQDLKTALEGRIDRAMANGQEKAAMLADIRKRFDQYLTNGPYFPLTRFGDFLVVATRDDGERVVASYESAGEQQSAARALEADGFTVKLKTAKTYNRSQDGAAGKFIGEVLTTIDKIDMVEATINGSRSDLKNQLLDDINQLFIKSMPDMSYRKHFAHRKNTPGFSADVMRGFASSAFHSASHIARLNHSDRMTFELEQAFKTIEQAPGGDFNKASQVLNEMANRHEAMLNPQAHPLSTLATQVGFTMYLGLSPAAGLINMLQVPMVAMPYIGARYGFAKTTAAMSKAYTDIMGAKVNRKSGFNAAQSPKLTAEERQAISTLQDEGVIDLTQAHDLAAATNRDIGNQARSRTSFAIARAMKIVGWTFHVPEVMNRQVTALMAYRLETDKGGSVEQAMDAAREAIKRTQFDYSSSNRARYMQGNVARVVTQFKQFSQNMTYFLGRAAYQALKDEDPDVRRIARRQILSTFAVTGAMAGSMGLPGIGFFGGLLALLAGAMSDDDEPWDWKAEYRNLLADTFGKEVGEVLAKGVPRALMPAWDISGRVGLADLWWRSNDREGQNPRESFASDMSNVLGPTAGSILGWYTAADHMQRGNYAKAVEAIVPKFIRDPIKAGREAADGITSYSGEPLMDTTAGEDLGRILGFAPARASEMYEARNAVMNAKTVIEEKRQALLSQIAKSIIDGDREAQAELRAEISGFNARNPAFTIGTPNIIQSVLAKRRNRANTQDGILLPQSKAALRDIGRFANIE